MLLSPSPISTDRFTYCDGVFVTEASGLGDFLLGRVYDDACDVGLTLVSHRTGAKVVYALHGEKRNSEGELLYTDFLPVRESLRNNQAAAHTRVRIYND